MLLPQERVKADKGYQDEYDKVNLLYKGLPKKSASLQMFAKPGFGLGIRRSMGVLSKNVWRHDLEKHKMTFHSVVALFQLGLQYERGLFEVDYMTFNIKNKQ